MFKNSQVLGLAAVLLIVAAQNQVDITRLPQNLHKMAVLVNHFDNLGQMALKAPTALQMFSTTENQETTIPELIGNNLPDFGKLMQNLGPLLGSLGTMQDNTGENGNALF